MVQRDSSEPEAPSSNFQSLLYQLHDLRVGLLRSAARIDNVYPLWLACCNRQIRAPHPPEKCAALLLKPVLIFLRTRALVLPIPPPRPLYRYETRVTDDGYVQIKSTAIPISQAVAFPRLAAS